MPIRVECDVCGAKYRVDDRRAGTEIPCKNCDADIWVPEPRRRGPERGGRRGRPAAYELDDDDFDDDDFDDEESGGLTPLLFIGGLIGCGLLLAGLIFFVMRAVKDDGPPPPDQVADNNADNKPAAPARPPANRPRPNQFAPRPNIRNQNIRPANPAQPVVDPNPDPNPNPVPQPRPRPQNPVVNNRPNENPPPPRGFLPPDENQAGLPPDLGGEWKVAFDAVPEAIAFEDGRKLRMSLPAGADVEDVLWPTSPSFFVALGRNARENEVREVYDIRTRQKIGRIGGFKGLGGTSVLSPDGKFFALSNNDSNGIYVWDVAESKPKGTLPLASNSPASVLNFAGPNRLAAAAGSKSPLQIWSLPDGTPQRTIPLPDNYVAESVAFSHGGKYAAVYSKDSDNPAIHIMDLDSGETAGVMSVPKKGRFWAADCRALMFSPDGEEIAGLFEESSEGELLYVFSLRDGQLNFEYKFEDRLRFTWGRASNTPIQWFPHRQRLLIYGNLIIDRGVGKVVWQFAKDRQGIDFAAGRRVLNNDQMMAVLNRNNKLSLESFSVEEDKIAKVADAVGSGGQLVDAKLPPLTAIDRSGVRELALDAGVGNWNAKPDPAPAGESALKDSVSVTATGGRMTGLLLSNPEAGLAAVYSQLQGPGIPRPRGSTSKNVFAHIDVYNLRTSRRTDQMDFEFPTQMAAFSPKGTRLASVLHPDQERVDLWSAADGKHVLALRPYNEEDKGKRKITAATFVDDEHLLTLNNEKKLVLWKLPECKAIYEIPEATQPGLSPNQQYLAVSTGRGYLLLDSRTGDQVGSFNIEGVMHAAAFHPDGTRFAASCQGLRGPSLVVWSMEDGSVLTEFPIQSVANQLHFCDKNHLLMNDDTLVDAEHRMIVWKYRLATGAHSPQSPDGRHWYVTPRGVSGAELVAATLPEPQVAQSLASRSLKPEYLLEPGGNLSVQINIPESGPGQENLRQRALKNLIDKYQIHGTSVGGGSALVLQMDWQERDTGKTEELTVRRRGRLPTFGGGESFTSNIKEIDCKITFLYKKEVVHVQSTKASSALGFFSQALPDGKSPEEVLNEKMWGGAAAFFTLYSPPVYVFRDFEGKGFGGSILTDRGPQPLGIGR